MLLAVRISSYGCTWEVWKALKKLELLSATPRATLKAGFHMIADRRSQIAIRSAIVCDHMETTSAIVCDPAIAIADDRRR